MLGCQVDFNQTVPVPPMVSIYCTCWHHFPCVLQEIRLSIFGHVIMAQSWHVKYLHQTQSLHSVGEKKKVNSTCIKYCTRRTN